MTDIKKDLARATLSTQLRREKLWTQAEKSVFETLKPKELTKLQQFITDAGVKTTGFSSLFEEYVKGFGNKKGKSPNKLLNAISKTMKLLEPFATVLDMAAFGTVVPSASLWAVLKIVAEVTGGHSDVFEAAFGMLETLLTVMPTFELYLDSFPEDQHLERSMVELYQEFMSVAVKTIRYFEKHYFGILLRLGWNRRRKDLQASIPRIEKLAAAVDQRFLVASKHKQNEHINAQIVTQQELKEGQEKIKELLASSSSPSPSLNHSNTITAAGCSHVRISKSSTCQLQNLHNIPYSRNPQFHGREDIIYKIHKSLSPEGSSRPAKMKFVTLYGLAGIGKTQIALEYAHRHRELYQACFWITTDTPEKASQGLCEIARKLNINDGDLSSTQSRVKEWFSATDVDWLLIFDNTVNVEDVSDYWPSGGKGSILLTSQNRNWIAHDEIDDAIRVNTLSDRDGADFIEHLLSKKKLTFEKEAAIELVSEVGGHPLAIRQMVAYLLTANLTLSNLLNLYRESAMGEHIWDTHIGNTYRFTVATVWKVQFDRLDENARYLLGVIALMNPEAIPEKLFSGASSHRFAIFKSPSKYHAAVDNLQKYSLITRDGIEETLSIHRLVRKRALLYLNSEGCDLQSTVDYAISALRRVYPQRSPLPKPLTHKWPECGRLISHIASLMDEIMERRDKVQIPNVMTDLLLDGALYLWERGLLAQGRKMTTCAMDICEGRADQKQLLADVYDYHAGILSHSGEHAETCKLFSEQVALAKDHLKSLDRQNLPVTIMDEVRLANAYNNLACAYLARREYSQAIIHHNLSIALKERWPMRQVSFLLGQSYANLANVYGQIEEWKNSEELFNKALTMDHVGFPLKEASTLHNFGCMRVARELPGRALHVLTKALDLRNRILGEHYETANTVHMISTCYRKIGDNKKAIGYLREAIRMMENSQANEILIARSKYSLSLVLAAEDINSASDLKQEAIGCGMKEDREQEFSEYWLSEDNLEQVFDALVAYI
ncbi:hypothetical protein EDC01DRAFT_371162 [Geopyxis carbonaria]|nr:hypothetical protein EDC01DRAFT_371162 [Geopyxis carbonaria]